MTVVVNYPEGNDPDEGPALEIHIGDTFKADFTNVLWLDPGRTKLWFTLKSSVYDGDADALFQATETAGVLVVAGAPAASPALGEVHVTSEGTPGNHGAGINIRIDDPATALFAPVKGAAYSIKQKKVDGREHTLLVGTADVILYATRAI